jgi:Ca-activated chloride channel family protein
LEAGDFIRAQTAYDRAAGFAARLGGGIAAYRRGDFPHAVERLQAAAWLAESDRQRRLVRFNLGNALVMAGRYRAAVSAYDAVLLLDPDHGPARQNRHIAVSLANVAGQREQSEEQPGFRGFDATRPDPIDETQGARMSEEFLEAEGSGRGGEVADQPDGGAEFVLNESLLQGARKKLERLDDRPQPPLRSLLRQQPYKSVVNDRLEGGEDER